MESSQIPCQSQNHQEKRKKENTKFPKRSNGRKFLGVRQRPSGRWVAEIKDSSQKLRLWLGTFDRQEDAAMAYDSAARLLRGRNAKTNFTHSGIITNHDENCSLLGKSNPRIYQLLKNVFMKNLEKYSSSLNFNTISNLENHNCCGGRDQAADSVGFDSLVIESGSCGFHQERENILRLSLGSSKVYSSVIVAPSFTPSLSPPEGEEDSNYYK